jgi:hypothetical protein
VDGLDASRDMLERCRAEAAARGLSVALHEAEMQSFSLPRRYRSIFLAGGSFSLLTTDADASSALACMHTHLLPGGSVLIPLTLAAGGPAQAVESDVPWTTDASGARLRCTRIAQPASADGRDRSLTLRYERILPGGALEAVEREIHSRLWSQAQFRELLLAPGFDKVTMIDPSVRGRATPEARRFVALARRDD